MNDPKTVGVIGILILVVYFALAIVAIELHVGIGMLLVFPGIVIPALGFWCVSSPQEVVEWYQKQYGGKP